MAAETNANRIHNPAQQGKHNYTLSPYRTLVSEVQVLLQAKVNGKRVWSKGRAEMMSRRAKP